MKQRKPNRLKEHDYSGDGYYYFLTICTKDRAETFGRIEKGCMTLNKFGDIAQDEWTRSQVIRPGIELDSFVVMPNHIHGIIMIRGHVSDLHRNAVGAHSCAPLQRRPRSLGSFVAGYKSSTTKRINELRQSLGRPVWQRNYHDHIIRTNESLEKIREYIINNPAQWALDPENVHNITRDVLLTERCSKERV